VNIATLLIALALAVPECRTVELGQKFDIVFTVPPWGGNWAPEHFDEAITQLSGSVAEVVGFRGHYFVYRFAFQTNAPGLTVLLFKEDKGACRVVLLSIAPQKGAKP
jgi:hypothetical protein